MHHISVVVSQDLDFHMPWPLDVLFEIDSRVAKCGLSFGTRLLKGRLQDKLVGGDAQCPCRPPPAVALISTGNPIS